ncbi:hypothetical protein WR25_09283 [Diploscapter pachys]|uniref:Uncharacterized protein n=1 Tax=Diploscapter pachys TaxID=2018661 RepID=A0A2A2LEF4_9BILA|nr:hypothetical protein WR25_09283 [Diploscapter pachys]
MSKTISDLESRHPEVLFVSASTSDPYPSILVDPRTGVSTWSYKGAQLQGSVNGTAILIGTRHDHLLSSVKDRGLLHAIATPNHDRFYAKAVLPGPIESMCATGDGTILFAAIRNQIFVWSLLSGELLCAFEAHYQPIVRIDLSLDESLLVTAGKDGVLQVYVVVDLLDANRGDSTTSPIRKWTAHYMAITDLSLSLSPDSNLRIATVGLDRTASIHSVALNSCLLKITADRPLTACVLDQSESRIFIGTDVGNIAQISLYKTDSSTDLTLQTSDEKDCTVPIFNGHEEAITKLSLNGDGCLLASGDKSGKYCIWDIRSRQCLKVSTMSGPISALRFVRNSAAFWAKNYEVSGHRPNLALERTITDSATISLYQKVDVDDKQGYFDGVMGQILERYKYGIPTSSKSNGSANLMSPAAANKLNAAEVSKNFQSAQEYQEEQRMSKKSKKRLQKKLNRQALFQLSKPPGKVDEVVIVSDEENEKNEGKELNEGNERQEQSNEQLNRTVSDSSQNESQEIAALKAEITRLKSINAELYKFGLERITQNSQ